MVKVGDKVRALKDRTDITKGRVYTVDHISNNSFCVKDNADDENWQLYYEGEDYEIVDVDGELTELRAWKESALARFPALAQRETDDEAAERFRDQFYNAGGLELVQGFLMAFAWARNNPA